MKPPVSPAMGLIEDNSAKENESETGTPYDQAKDTLLLSDAP